MNKLKQKEIVMKIAVTAMGSNASDPVSTRFGRAPYFVIFEDQKAQPVKSIENPNVQAGGGAGIQSAQSLSDEGVDTVLTGNCGPKAFQVFGAAGIEIYTDAAGSVGKALEDFRAGRLSKADTANVGSHSGM